MVLEQVQEVVLVQRLLQGWVVDSMDCREGQVEHLVALDTVLSSL